MKFEYDKDADAAYIYLEYLIQDGQVKNTIELNDNITLDFDHKGKLLGVEILDASKVLNKKTLMEANTNGGKSGLTQKSYLLRFSNSPFFPYIIFNFFGG